MVDATAYGHRVIFVLLRKNTKKRATHNQYFKEFAALTVSVDKALAYFATHPETVSGLFGLYCQESGLELKQAA